MNVPRTFRPAVAIGMVLGFNLLMLALAAMAGGPIEAPFVVAWMLGDFAVCLAALALTD